MSYLAERKAVILDGQDSILAIFPLTRTIVGSTDRQLNIFTNENAKNYTKSNIKLRLNFNSTDFNNSTSGTIYDFYTSFENY